VPAPEIATRTINHNEPSLQISSYQKGAAGEATTELKYTTDGKPVENKVPREPQSGMARNWVWIAFGTIKGGFEAARCLALSSDGKTLTVNSHLAVRKVSSTLPGFSISNKSLETSMKKLMSTLFVIAAAASLAMAADKTRFFG